MKLVLNHNKFYVESKFKSILEELLEDPTIRQARCDGSGASDAFLITKGLRDKAIADLTKVDALPESTDFLEEDNSKFTENEVYAFEIDPYQV